MDAKRVWIVIWECESEHDVLAAFSTEAAADAYAAKNNAEWQEEERQHLRRSLYRGEPDADVEEELNRRIDAGECGQCWVKELSLDQ